MQSAAVDRVTVALGELSAAAGGAGDVRCQGGVLPRGGRLLDDLFGLQALVEDFVVHFVLVHGPRHGRGHHARLMKQRLLETAHGAAVQNTLPPVIHHEFGQVHDQDVARRLLAAAANVRDHCLHGIAVGRVDDRQRHWDVEGVPAVLHDLESRAVVVDGERLNRRGTRGTRVREGTHRGPAHAFHVHDGVHA